MHVDLVTTQCIVNPSAYQFYRKNKKYDAIIHLSIALYTQYRMCDVIDDVITSVKR